MELPVLIDFAAIFEAIRLALGEPIGEAVGLGMSLYLIALTWRKFKEMVSGSNPSAGSGGDPFDVMTLTCPYCSAEHGMAAMYQHLTHGHDYSVEEADIEITYLMENEGLTSTDARFYLRELKT